VRLLVSGLLEQAAAEEVREELRDLVEQIREEVYDAPKDVVEIEIHADTLRQSLLSVPVD
jgi:uncharacterized protein Yka (UPF0111/DUF47 family)